MKRISLFLMAGLSLAFLLSACGSQPAQAATTTAATGSITGLRDTRYCEVIPVTQNFLTLQVKVYNTIGLNDCPADLWKSLDPAQLAKQFGAIVVKMNGPRYWVLDGIVGSGVSAGGEKVNVGGIEMQFRAGLKTYLWQGSIGDKFYTPNQVQRDTIFQYSAGQPVYELVSPQGEVYRMQSYSQIADPNLSMADLADLGARLKLPAGWKYQTHILSANEALNSHGLASVINDDLYDSYQKVIQ